MLMLGLQTRLRQRLHILLLLLIIGCQQTGAGADKPVVAGQTSVEAAALSTQLRIYQRVLFEGADESIRVDTAAEILASEDPLARQVLIDALNQAESSIARIAVCKALSRTRTGEQDISNKQDFIQPLVTVLTTEDSQEAEAAAQACLIFDYDQIAEPLDKMVTDATLPIHARVNAVNALRLQPDKEAIIKLVQVLDDPEKRVVAAARNALETSGVPLGTDARSRAEIIKALRSTGMDDFLRSWVARQGDEMRKMQAEVESWRRLYLEALGAIYNSQSDDAAREEFLAQCLGDEKPPVVLWGLGKAADWRKGTSKKLSIKQIEPILVKLLANPNKDVRFQTASLLSLIGDLDCASQLLEQIKVEEDDEVKMQMFVALGVACSPAAPGKVTPEIRKQALVLAKEYLAEEDPVKARRGAEVTKKLLERDGMAPQVVAEYLGALENRYDQEKNNSDGTLRGQLLSTMAALCAQSAYKTEAASRFEGAFDEAIDPGRNEHDSVREAAVNGLIYIDETKALGKFRADARHSDSSGVIREKIINLAGKVGGQKDLDWLWGKIGATEQSELAWQAMLKIFMRSEAAVLWEWMTEKLDADKARLSDDQRISFLEIAERKAGGENSVEMLGDIRAKLALLYRESGNFERAEEALQLLLAGKTPQSPKDAVLADLLDVYLRWPKTPEAAKLLNNRLKNEDLQRNSPLAATIERYLDESPPAAEREAVLRKLLRAVRTPEDRVIWQEMEKHWKERLDESVKLDKGGETEK